MYIRKSSLEKVPDGLGDSGSSLLLLLSPALGLTLAHRNPLDLLAF